MIVLRNKEFTKADYLGLSKKASKYLNKKRSELAKILLKDRANYKKSIEKADQFEKMGKPGSKKIADILRKNAVKLKDSNIKTIKTLANNQKDIAIDMTKF